MTYIQIGTLIVIGLLVFILFFVYLIDLNKDTTFQNRRQKQTKPQLEMIRSNKRPRMKERPKIRPEMKERTSHGRIERGPRGPEKRR